MKIAKSQKKEHLIFIDISIHSIHRSVELSLIHVCILKEWELSENLNI